MITRKRRERYNVQIFEDVKISIKYAEKVRLNLGSTNIEKTDDQKDFVDSI